MRTLNSQFQWNKTLTCYVYDMHTICALNFKISKHITPITFHTSAFKDSCGKP